jgi:hypothetical protein
MSDGKLGDSSNSVIGSDDAESRLLFDSRREAFRLATPEPVHLWRYQGATELLRSKCSFSPSVAFDRLRPTADGVSIFARRLLGRRSSTRVAGKVNSPPSPRGVQSLDRGRANWPGGGSMLIARADAHPGMTLLEW